VGDAIENDLPRGQLDPFNRVLFRIPVQEDVQFRHFGNPTAIDFTVEFDRELHSHRLAPMAGVIEESAFERADLHRTIKAEACMVSEYVEQREGVFYVGATRISLDSIVYAFREGCSPESIREDFEGLTLAQVYGAISF
jgi:uncharacterized protein (DUF433 family)